MNTSDNTNIKINHEIWNLPPAESYDIYIDESYVELTGSGEKQALHVAVVIPEGVELPIPQTKHTTEDKSYEKQKEDLEQLFKVHSGVAGFYSNPHGGNQILWCVDLLKFIPVILSLLSEKGAKRCRFFIEECGEWSALKRTKNTEGQSILGKTREDAQNTTQNRLLSLIYRTFESYFQQVSSLQVAIKFVPKEFDSLIYEEQEDISPDDCRKVSYADLVSYLSTRPNREPFIKNKALLRENIGDFALWNIRELHALNIAIEKKSGDLEYADWLYYSNAHPDSYEAYALKNAAKEAVENPALWRKFLIFTLTYLDSKAIRMELLVKQVKWLDDNKPRGATLPKKLQLMLLQAKIAESNHRGEILPKDAELEFNEITKILKREDIRLVAEVCLHVATSYTNAFKFKEAKACLLKLRAVQPIALGLKLQGRISSALGQCEAFLGNHKEAIKLFDEAIKLFRQQVDDEGVAGDIDQTLSYKIIARIDSCTEKMKDRSRLQTEVAEYLGRAWDALPVISRCIATRRNKEQMAKEKYHHHVLLRYLASGHAPENILTAYESARGRWNHGEDFHPWELIEFYRAVLFDDSERFSRAEEICNENGITLKVIKLAIVGASNPERLKSYIAQEAGLMSVLQKNLPRPANAAINKWCTLKNPNPSKKERLKFFSSVLPFNFR